MKPPLIDNICERDTDIFSVSCDIFYREQFFENKQGNPFFKNRKMAVTCQLITDLTGSAILSPDG